MEKKTGYDAVVFDMDGVIFDSERAVMQCWAGKAWTQRTKKSLMAWPTTKAKPLALRA